MNRKNHSAPGRTAPMRRDSKRSDLPLKKADAADTAEDAALQLAVNRVAVPVRKRILDPGLRKTLIAMQKNYADILMRIDRMAAKSGRKVLTRSTDYISDDDGKPGKKRM